MTRFAVDFRYFEIEYELWALEQMLKVIEPAIESLAGADAQQAVDEISRQGWEPGDGDGEMLLQEVYEKRDYVLPRFMRGPFLVSVWACFETAVQSVARLCAKEIEAPIRMNELRGDDFLKRAIRYFDAILGLPLDSDGDRLKRLNDLYVIRCALAHANGLREGMSDEKWAELCKALGRQGLAPDSRDLVLLTENFVACAYDDVRACLKDLVARARQSSDRERERSA